jgi:hypothetical protein
MKNKLIAASLLTVMVISLSSCFASRSKYGCPATVYKAKTSNKS